MILYLKTNFLDSTAKLKVSKIEIQHENLDLINAKEYPKFKNIEDYGILNLKIHPLEAKKWYDSLSKEAKDGNYILAWDGGWLSIPGEEIEEIAVDQAE